ncbi:transposable element Tc1 transposase [Trichonephila clavipes]|nr:transposable element Tc1 transposase [Trichonephila clavipes]
MLTNTVMAGKITVAKYRSESTSTAKALFSLGKGYVKSPYPVSFNKRLRSRTNCRCVTHGPFNFRNRQTAKIFKVDSVKSIPRIDRWWTKTSNRTIFKGQLALTVRSERRFGRIIYRQRCQTLAQITNQLNDGASCTVRERTVQRSFHRMSFGSHRPTRVPLLNARHRAARLAWAREHRDWRSQLATGWLDEHTSDLSVINWPPKSPDLNPIKHVWDVLEQGRKGHHKAPTSLTELWTVLANIRQVGTFPETCSIYASVVWQPSSRPKEDQLVTSKGLDLHWSESQLVFEVGLTNKGLEQSSSEF